MLRSDDLNIIPILAKKGKICCANSEVCLLQLRESFQNVKLMNGITNKHLRK